MLPRQHYAPAMRLALAGPPVVAALVLASCGETTVDAGMAEAFIRGVVVEQIGARVASVRCPEGVKAKKGGAFTCTVTGADGSKGNVEVTQKNDNDALEVDVPFLHMREAERVMADRIQSRVKANVTVACPEIVVDRKAGLFTCRSTIAGNSRRISARLTDGAGHFRFRLPTSPPRRA
jgi:hypothetical protein